jgi:DNA repair protein RadA/Sms
MPKVKTSFVCQQCGTASLKWLGRCPSCNSWDSLVEQAPEPVKSGPRAHAPRAVPLSKALSAPEPRISTGVDELNRVLGGGLVQGMVVLVGGEPGIGKSTLMLKLASNWAAAGSRCSMSRLRNRFSRWALGPSGWGSPGTA